MKCCFQKVLEPTKINLICQKAGNALKLSVLTQVLNLKGFTRNRDLTVGMGYISVDMLLEGSTYTSSI